MERNITGNTTVCVYISNIMIEAENQVDVNMDSMYMHNSHFDYFCIKQNITMETKHIFYISY